jgi:hypothetical protein
MIIGDIVLWLLMVCGAWLALTTTWLSTVALFPRLTGECQERYGSQAVWAMLLGLVTVVPGIIIAITLFKFAPHPLARLIAVLIPVLLLLLALVGSSGLAGRIGAGLSSPGDVAQPWRRVLRGGWVLSCSFLMPLLGWFVLLPLALLSGIGVALLVLWRRRYPLEAPAAA